VNPQFIFAVAIGGALGSVVRYLVAVGSGRLFGPGFPIGTLIINVTGSALIGAFTGLFATKWDLPPAVRIFLTVGICGGAWYLIERGQSTAALAYRVLSVAVFLAALVSALHFVRALS
jgi:CrcB protein